MAGVRLESVRKVFESGGDEIVAVNDVDLEIRDGEFLVLVGPSGSGKSTLLRMIAGLERQTDGDISIGGEVVNDYKPRRRDIAMAFQSYALYPNMTVRGNMSFGLKMSTDLSAEEIDAKVTETAEMMGIGELLDNNPGQLSGGQKQRVALGRAIVRDPNVFLMDEPLSNLDAKLRTTMRTEINRLQDQLGVTTIYVTHDQTEAMTMSDRLVILDGGEIQQVGTPLECFYRPANRFVAGFIGSPSMNFFPVDADGATLRGEGIAYELPAGIERATDGHTELTLGVRPEDIAVVDDPQSDNDIECTVDVIEPMGSVKYVYLHTDEMDAEFIAEVDGQQPLAVGDSAYAHVPEETVYLFDRSTGTALHHREVTDDAELDLSARLEGSPAEG
ncbi:ABC transporter ATP-binding protein [Natrarchaeobius sp. A-rgal3]|uniref:ABC transporter ATP-binding protein n=1 Tax=Natrarchaeobius versutus TaxID=1679078 RepID=UPI00350FD043